MDRGAAAQQIRRSTGHTPPMTKSEITQLIAESIQREGLSYGEIANRLGKPPVWTTAALLGQHPFEPSDAETLIELLDLPAEAKPALEAIPMRGALDAAVPTDPTIYRLYEVLQVYGPALKALIHEELGDGIMSAINFKLDVERVPDPAGDRVRITMDGKFLPYQWG
jgi:cyanate lyase